MAEILEVILEHVSIWAPALVSILATIGAVLGVCAKGAAALQQIKESTEFAAVRTELQETRQQLIQQNRLNALLIDKIAKIEGYSDAKINTN